MSRITEAIERIGGVLEEPRAALDRLAGRRARRQRRRRVEAGVLSVAVVVGGFFGITRAVVGPHGGPAVGPTPPVPSCVFHGSSGHPSLAPVAGPPGSTVAVTGEISAYGPGGTYVGPPTGSVQVWWNMDLTSWWDANFGPVPPNSSLPPTTRHPGRTVLMATRALDGRCSYRMSFRVPNVAPGTYPVMVRRVNSEGEMPEGWTPFSVTTGSASEQTCTSSQLAVKRTKIGLGAGQATVQLTFSNTSQASCALRGFPRIALLDRKGVTIPASVGRLGPPDGYPEPSTVLLGPGGAASFVVGYSDGTGYNPSVCRTGTLQVTPPGSASALMTGVLVRPCTGSGMHEFRLGVSAVFPGTSPPPAGP